MSIVTLILRIEGLAAGLAGIALYQGVEKGVIGGGMRPKWGE